MGQIRLLPTANGYLEAELRHNAEGLIRLALGDPYKVRMVAGARFELTSTTPYFVRTVRLKVSNRSHRKVALKAEIVNNDISSIKSHTAALAVFPHSVRPSLFCASLRAKEWLLW